MRRRVDPNLGREALKKTLEALAADSDMPELATAVRFLLEELGTEYPGRTLEVRVAPYGAVQCLAGPTHTRGTPPNVVECAPVTWIRLATGKLSWSAALDAGLVQASGVRASLETLLPLKNLD